MSNNKCPSIYLRVDLLYTPFYFKRYILSSIAQANAQWGVHENKNNAINYKWNNYQNVNLCACLNLSWYWLKKISVAFEFPQKFGPTPQKNLSAYLRRFSWQINWMNTKFTKCYCKSDIVQYWSLQQNHLFQMLMLNIGISDSIHDKYSCKSLGIGCFNSSIY